MIKIDTERLTISPMTEKEMQEIIDKYKVREPELSAAYQEMLDGCIEYPTEYVWYCAWKIALTDGQVRVGDADFKGFHGGCPEIGYGLDQEHWGKGYATEAVAALCAWAFSMPGVVAVEAETDPDNETSKRVLSKVGFLSTGEMGEEGPRFKLSKA